MCFFHPCLDGNNQVSPRLAHRLLPQVWGKDAGMSKDAEAPHEQPLVRLPPDKSPCIDSRTKARICIVFEESWFAALPARHKYISQGRPQSIRLLMSLGVRLASSKQVYARRVTSCSREMIDAQPQLSQLRWGRRVFRGS